MCFKEYLFLSFLWTGQRTNSEMKAKTFMKKAGSLMEQATGYIGWNISEPIISVEVRSLERVYGFDYDEPLYPSRTDCLADLDLEEEGVERELCPVLFNNDSLGTTIYGSYKCDKGDRVRAIICSDDEIPHCLCNSSLHEYAVGIEGEEHNSVGMILKDVKGKIVGPAGEITSKWGAKSKKDLDIRTLLNITNQTKISYLQAAYLYSGPAIKLKLGSILEDNKLKPDVIMLALERRATKIIAEQILTEIGEESPSDSMKIVLGSEKFEMLANRTFGVSDATIDIAVQSELEKIDPRILPLALRGGLCLTKKNRQMIEIACRNVPWEIIGRKNEVFLKLLLNECFTVENRNRDTEVTREIFEEIICTMDDTMKHSREELDETEFWFEKTETISSFSYSI